MESFLAFLFLFCYNEITINNNLAESKTTIIHFMKSVIIFDMLK